MLDWFKLASHLKIPVQTLKREITSMEFVLWKLYLEEQWNSNSKQDYYLAQICSSIFNAFTGSKTKAENFLIKFKSVSSVKKKRSLQSIKNFFYAAVGIDVSPEDSK